MYACVCVCVRAHVCVCVCVHARQGEFLYAHIKQFGKSPHARLDDYAFAQE